VNQWGPAKKRSPCTYLSGFGDQRDKDACDALVLGSLINQLLPLQIWPGNPNEVASRINYLSIAHLSMRLDHLMKCHTYPSGRHTNCGFVTKLTEGTRRIVANMPSGIQDSHRTHMATQRQKLSQSNTLFEQLRQPDPNPSRAKGFQIGLR